MATIEKALSLLDLFSEQRPVIGLTDFSRLARRDKATVYRHLESLEAQGFLEQDPKTRAYRLGHAISRLAAMRAATVSAAESVAPIIDQMSRETGELVHLTRLNGYDLKRIYQADLIDKAIRISLESHEILPVLTSASGKAALAFGPKTRIDAAIADNHARFGTPPMPSASDFIDEMAVTAERGYSRSADQVELGVSSVGVPVFDENGLAIGACAVAFPTIRSNDAHTRQCCTSLFEHAPALSAQFGGIVPAHITKIWHSFLNQTSRTSS